MKIALINENSQAAKNSMIEAALKEVVEPMGHEVVNYGMYSAEDEAQLTYVQCGLLAAILLNSGAVDFVVTGCGTGEGATLALNAFPGVLCGHVVDPSDGYMFAQINDGNAIAMPFAKGFGWGAELNLKYTFEKLFGCEPGNGYPPERVVPEQRNKKILDGIKKITHTDMMTILKNIDQDFLKETVSGPKFKELFFDSCKCPEIKAYIENATLALNAFPGVLCGHVVDPSDGYMFAQINDGNAIAMPFAKGFGWGAELNLKYTFEKLFGCEPGNGYPPERVVPEQRNKKILDGIKKITHTDMMTILKNIDQDFLKETVSGPKFKELFFDSCKCPEIKAYIENILK